MAYGHFVARPCGCSGSVSCSKAASSISRAACARCEWMDKENQKRYTTEIIASDMKLLGKRSDNPAGGQSAGQGGYQPQGGVQGGYAAPASQAGGYAQPAAQPCSRRRSGRSAGRRSRRSAVLKRLRQGMMPYSFHVLTGAAQRNGTRIFIQR